MIHKDMFWLFINKHYNGDVKEYLRQKRLPEDAMEGWLNNTVQLPDYIKDELLSSCREYEVGAKLVGIDKPILITQIKYDKIKKLCDKFGDSIDDTLSGVVTGGNGNFVGGAIDVDNILLLMHGYDIADNYLLDDNIPV